MAQGNGVIYNNFKEQVMEGEFDLASGADAIKVALVSSGYTPNIDTHTQWSDASGSELSGTGYTAGGETLGSQDVTQDNTNDLGKFDGANVTWTGLDAGTPAYCVMYDDTHASDLLLAYWEVTTASNGGDYTLAWHADGIITLT